MACFTQICMFTCCSLGPNYPRCLSMDLAEAITAEPLVLVNGDNPFASLALSVSLALSPGPELVFSGQAAPSKPVSGWRGARSWNLSSWVASRFVRPLLKDSGGGSALSVAPLRHSLRPGSDPCDHRHDYCKQNKSISIKSIL